MKKKVILIFVIGFVSIYLFSSLAEYLYNKRTSSLFESQKQSMPSQEYRSNDETAELFVESFIRTYYMLVNNEHGEFTYLDSMVDKNIEESIIKEVNQLRKLKIKVDYDYEVTDMIRHGDNYKYIININEVRIDNKAQEKNYSYKIIIEVKEVNNNFKVIYKNDIK